MSRAGFRFGSLIILLATVTQAQVPEGWTNWATPTQVDIVTAGTPGIMVYGAFGDPGACGVTGTARFFVPKTGNEEQYAQIVSAVIAANVAGRQIRGYVSSCAPHLWYSGTEVEYGQVVGAAVNFRN